MPLRTSCYPKRIQKVTLFGRSQKTFHNFSHSWLKDSNLTRCNQMVNFPWLWQKRRAKGDTLKGVEVTQVMLDFFGNPPFSRWFFRPGFNLIFICFLLGGMVACLRTFFNGNKFSNQALRWVSATPRPLLQLWPSPIKNPSKMIRGIKTRQLL